MNELDLVRGAVERWQQGPDEDGDYWIEPEDAHRFLRDIRSAIGLGVSSVW